MVRFLSIALGLGAVLGVAQACSGPYATYQCTYKRSSKMWTPENQGHCCALPAGHDSDPSNCPSECDGPAICVHSSNRHECRCSPTFKNQCVNIPPKKAHQGKPFSG